MKTLWLHVGTPKTGTSSIQQFCFENWGVLRKLGFAFLKVPFRYQHLPQSQNGHFLYLEPRPSESSESAAARRDKTERGYAQLERAFTQRDNVVCSDELLWAVCGKSDSLTVRTLKEHSVEHGYTVKIIVYLRRQDLLAESWYNQRVQQGIKGKDSRRWGRWLSGQVRESFDYAGVLDGVASVFGADNITVRVYDRSALEAAGGLEADFLSCLGLSIDEGFIPLAHESNSKRLAPNFLEIKRIVNGSPNKTFENGHLFRRAADICSAEVSDEPHWRLFSAEEARAFLAQFEEGNARVAREYLHTDAPLFDMTVGDVRKWTIANKWMVGDIIRYFQCVNRLQDERADAEARGAEAGAAQQAAKGAKGAKGAGTEARKADVGDAQQGAKGAAPDIDRRLARAAWREPIVRNTRRHAIRVLAEYFLLRDDDMRAGREVGHADDAAVEALVRTVLAESRHMVELQEKTGEPGPRTFAGRVSRKLRRACR